MADIPSERKVILVMDASLFLSFALDWYVYRIGDAMIIAHCLEPVSTYGPERYVQIDLQREEEGRAGELPGRLGERLTNAGIVGRCRRGTGVPGYFIVKTAEEEDAAMILIGSRGLGSLRRTSIGSVSDYVIHHAHVSVIVCRHKDVKRNC